MAAVEKYSKIIKYMATAVCVQPLHIGSASGEKDKVLVHPADGKPFLQGSGISGALRQHCEAIHGAERTNKLFGSRLENAGEAADVSCKVRWSDGTFNGQNLIMELRPRVKLDPVSGTAGSSQIKGTDKQAGHKFNMEYIGAGAGFVFSAYLYDEGFQKELEDLFAALHRGNIQLGGQKSNGCGFMELTSLKRSIFDMSTVDGRKRWADEETLPEQAYEEIIDNLGVSDKTATAYEVIVTGSTEGELLVKSMVVQDYGKDAPDCMNIRNAKKDYIVPGSSLKGAVRNQMEKIASYIGNTALIEDAFGKTGKKKNKGKAGNIVFRDTIVGNREENDLAPIKKRIHIDKFTGGVINGGLFNEKNVFGDLDFHIDILDRNQPDASCGLLLLALRDMASGMMGIGSGYSVGKGIIDVEKIEIRDRASRKAATVEYITRGESGIFPNKTGRITDESGIIARCLNAAQGKEAAK